MGFGFQAKDISKLSFDENISRIKKEKCNSCISMKPRRVFKMGERTRGKTNKPLMLPF
uniref:Uncharacterized protein n=1 Tax=Octopus bimaculoides TaxID=37653 RepID=A0A0L8H0P7_OCTBM